jgi:hypothetical protein
LATWADLQRLQPRWVLWAVLVVLVLDLRAVVHLRDDGPGCAHGTLPRAEATLATSLALTQSRTRSGDDVHVTLRMENPGQDDVLVAGLQVVVVAPATDEVLGWADPVRPLGLVVRPGEFGEVALIAHLSRCPGRAATALAPGWYELVVVVTESDAVVRPIVVAP